MSYDIVIIPTYNRPEYLWLAIEKLAIADRADVQSREFWICEDNHIQEKDGWIQYQMIPVLEEARKIFKNFRYICREPHDFYGNSFNVLEAFREAVNNDPRYVYLVEDDVMVTPDFFRWHEVAQEQWHPFVSCAGRINRSLNFEMNGREAIDETCKDPLACVASRKAYGSWASCFTRTSLLAILEEVYSFDFCNKIGPGNEQDIFIQRLMQKCFSSFSHLFTDTTFNKSFSVWPYVPRAYHLGMQSYHRNAGLSFNGSLQEKVNALRSTITSKEKIKSMALLQDDIDPYPTSFPEWKDKLYLKADYR